MKTALPVVICSLFIFSYTLHAAYNLEVPPDPREEFRQQYLLYSRHLQKALDRTFVNDFQGALVHLGRAVEQMPDEGLAYGERAKIYKLLGKNREAEQDFSRAIHLFDKGIARARTASKEKTAGKKGKNSARQPDVTAGKSLESMLLYQKGETLFGCEKHSSAREAFNAACSAGNSLACGRLKELDLLEARGINWIPLSALHFYDANLVERVERGVVRVPIRSERMIPADSEKMKLHTEISRLEISCDSRKFRKQPAMGQDNSTGRMLPEEMEWHQPDAASYAERLVIILCGPVSPENILP